MMNTTTDQSKGEIRPYVLRTYDRWIILVVVLVAGWFLFRPLFGYGVYYRGLSFERMLDFTMAEHYYAKSTRVYPYFVEPWLALAVLQGMDGRVDHADYVTALSTLKDGLEHNPHSGGLSFQMCRDYYEIGRDYPSAFQSCARSVRDDRSNKFAWDYGAWAAVRSGDKKSAIDYWRQVLRLDPKFVAAEKGIAAAER